MGIYLVFFISVTYAKMHVMLLAKQVFRFIKAKLHQDQIYRLQQHKDTQNNVYSDHKNNTLHRLTIYIFYLCIITIIIDYRYLCDLKLLTRAHSIIARRHY